MAKATNDNEAINADLYKPMDKFAKISINNRPKLIIETPLNPLTSKGSLGLGLKYSIILFDNKREFILADAKVF